MANSEQCKNCQTKVETFQSDLKKVIEDIAAGVSEEELTEIAPQLTNCIEPKEFYRVLEKELQKCVSNSVELAWNEFNTTDKLHQLEQMENNAGDEESTSRCSSLPVNEVDPFVIKKHFLQLKKQTLIGRTAEIRKETEEIRSQIREKRQQLKDQMEQMALVTKTIENAMQETKEQH